MPKYTFTYLTYRQQTEGIVKRHAGNKIPSIPDFSTINKRINRLNVKIKDDNNKNINLDDGYIIIAVDSTGIKVTNRSQWMNKNGI